MLFSWNRGFGQLVHLGAIEHSQYIYQKLFGGWKITRGPRDSNVSSAFILKPWSCVYTPKHH